MRNFTLLAIFIAFSTFSFAQHPSCDGSRYLNPTYTVDQTDGIVFGNSTTYDGVNADLLLDFFEPSGDAAASRPLIILAFGGSFIAGSRDAMHEYCNYYASHGYACASIDYRLYDGPLFPIPDSATMTDAVVKAQSDMKAAIRFFKEDAATTNTYRVDPNFITVGGISAGAIVALHIGMMDPTDVVEPYILPIIDANGGWEGNSSSNTQYDTEVMGILNFSGALRSADYIESSDAPVFSVHDDGDDVVPYANGYASMFGIPIIALQGSSVIHQEAQADGLNSELITYAGSTGHVSYFGNQTSADSILGRSLDFMYPLICGVGANVNELVKDVDFKLYPNPAHSTLTIEVAEINQYTVSLLDLSGRKVLSQSGNSSKTTLSVSDLNSGVYLVEIVSEDGTLSERKQLIVQ